MDHEQELYEELREIEQDLQQQAADAKRTADGMRSAACEHDGRAIGLLAAADALKDLERPTRSTHLPRFGLTDERIKAIAEGMPGGIDGFLKGWGWQQFARAIEEAHGIRAD